MNLNSQLVLFMGVLTASGDSDFILSPSFPHYTSRILELFYTATFKLNIIIGEVGMKPGEITLHL